MPITGQGFVQSSGTRSRAPHRSVPLRTQRDADEERLVGYRC